MASPLSDVHCCVIRPFARGPWLNQQHPSGVHQIARSGLNSVLLLKLLRTQFGIYQSLLRLLFCKQIFSPLVFTKHSLGVDYTCVLDVQFGCAFHRRMRFRCYFQCRISQN
jgi:hypothetical protein